MRVNTYQHIVKRFGSLSALHHNIFVSVRRHGDHNSLPLGCGRVTAPLCDIMLPELCSPEEANAAGISPSSVFPVALETTKCHDPDITTRTFVAWVRHGLIAGLRDLAPTAAA